MLFLWLMLSLFISLFICGNYLRWKHKGNRLIYLASLMILCGSLFALQMILEKTWLPFAISQEFSPTMISISTIITTLFNVLINTAPYILLLIFFLIYSGMMLHQRWIYVVASLPLWISLLEADYLNNSVSTVIIAIWGAVYIVVSISLAARTFWREKHIREIYNELIIASLMIIPVFILNLYHFAQFPLSDKLISLIPYVCIICLLMVSSLYMRDAFLGVKRKSEQTIHAGTGVIHHSIKNSISKVKLNALNIRKSLKQGKVDDVEKYVDNLLKTYQNMNDTMSNLSRVINTNVDLKLEKVDLAEILDEVLASTLINSNIEVKRNYTSSLMLLDRTLMTECLQNICNNAVESINDKGMLEISLEHNHNKVILYIQDTGRGMTSVELENIFEPFYSTKLRSGKNFGIGMFQVKKVILAHKGKIQVKSRPRVGTTIIITLFIRE